MPTKGSTVPSLLAQPRNIWLFYSPRGSSGWKWDNTNVKQAIVITTTPVITATLFTGATSSSSQPPNIAEVASQPSKSPAKRFKSPAKKLRPWMW
ncbi:hypothetical protein Pyn_19348 [Prunus yedoensis var. nudiflora]|uniref:Uncharacterized protein n=1 Tax=Prunus yedoensis var. nudiflora TaxID=2094558 RepID=A0A314YC83_PRUYE|nr:hypothetical protein Pyn_19348 [Prunus yedoensis var. nudiflora]